MGQDMRSVRRHQLTDLFQFYPPNPVRILQDIHLSTDIPVFRVTRPR